MVFEIIFDFLKYLPFLILLLFFGNFIGVFILTFNSNRIYDKLALPLGILFITFITALIAVKFESVFMLISPFILIYLLKNHTFFLSFKQILDTSWKNSKSSFLPTIIIYSISYLSCLKTDLFPYFDVCRDDLFYIHLSDFISHNSVESVHITWYPRIKELGISQYHYFEMYLNIFITKISGIKSTNTYIHILIPLISIVYYDSLLFLKRRITKQNSRLYSVFLILIVLVIPPVKFGTTIPPIILLIHAFHNKKYLLSLFSATLLLVINPLFLVFIFPVFITYFLINYLKHKTVNKKSLYTLIGVFSIYFSFSVIQSIFKGDISELNNGLFSISDFIDYYKDSNHYKTLFHYWIKLSYRIFEMSPFLFIIFLLLAVYVKKNKIIIIYRYEILSILIMSTVYSIIGSGLLHFMQESFQIFQFSGFIFLYTIIPILFFSLNLEQNKTIIYSCLIIMFSFFVFSKKETNFKEINDIRLGKYSKSYFDKVTTETAKYQKVNILRFLKDDQYLNSSRFNPYNSFEGFFLTFNNKIYNLHTFNLKSVPYKVSLHNYYNYNRSKLLPLVYDYNYFKNYSNLTDEEMLTQFLKDHEIQFFLIEPDAKVPSNLSNYSKKSFLDSSSGEVFISIQNYEK